MTESQKSIGCGKSTCVQLLQRLYDPAEGEITFDGVDIRQLNVKWLRSQMGVVGQEPVLFNTTIAKNISFGLTGGYDTRVGERGASLSGGQKQGSLFRGRALVRNPSALLLDEATSALDFQSESIVQAALERASQGRSTIIIAHRLSTIRAADVIYVVDKGLIVEQGTHTELMEKRGRYYQLVLSQEESEIMRGDAAEEPEGEVLEDNFVEEYMDTEPGTGRITSRTRLISVTSADSIPKPMEDKEEEKKESESVSFFRLWKANLQSGQSFLIVVSALLSKDSSYQLTHDVEVINHGRFYCFAYLGIAVGMGICGFLQKMLVGFSGECFTYRVRKQLFSCLLEQDISFFDESQNTVGKLTHDFPRMLPVFAGNWLQNGRGFAGICHWKVMNSDNVIERDSIESSCNIAVEALNNIRTVASLGLKNKALIYCTMSGGAAISYAPAYDKGKIAAARIFELFDATPLISRFSQSVAVFNSLGTVKGQVDFENVNFNYKNRPSVKVLKSLNLSVKPGESVAICGPSETIIGYRQWKVNKFDGVDLRRLNLDYVRQQIALVSQEPILFDCSIKDNIAYGNNERVVEMDEIINAAIATNMHNFITSLPAVRALKYLCCIRRDMRLELGC
ncbi:Multidrug resistance protein 1 [Orchesella cincta]|uniref:Multidrug resistance protein 1 n=1 Tax=Orchesella cincta TaxID=48709 RepID=A0A1D2M1L7_ORCCI|nr:Multidrug resistance protein 1 [Orchesella cincta]